MNERMNMVQEFNSRDIEEGRETSILFVSFAYMLHWIYSSGTRSHACVRSSVKGGGQTRAVASLVGAMSFVVTFRGR